MSEWKPINLNDEVMVRLKPRGLEILRSNHYALLGPLGERHPFKAPEVDEDGWSRFQLWTLMQEFGPHISIGMDVPFETEIKIVTP